MQVRPSMQCGCVILQQGIIRCPNHNQQIETDMANDTANREGQEAQQRQRELSLHQIPLSPSLGRW